MQHRLRLIALYASSLVLSAAFLLGTVRGISFSSNVRRSLAAAAIAFVLTSVLAKLSLAILGGLSSTLELDSTSAGDTGSKLDIEEEQHDNQPDESS